MRQRYIFGALAALGLYPGRGLHAEEATPAGVEHESGSPADNSVFIELLGNGLVYSVNYERFLLDGHLSLRAGVGYVPTFRDSNGFQEGSILSVPLLVNGFFGNTRHKLQVGAGVSLFAGTGYAGSTPAAVGTGVVGYRYVPREGGVTFGAGFTPLLGNTGSSLLLGLLPLVGVSLGATF